ncbi:polygalacturonase 1 beta-like protein 3 [Juglans microcarpa x Juglans regia]|uniref:polygalacturonase 1 beta-like protein 3 n=1 Tax=Juglans microcarpa x Juglans regia TaxID=2249226 RepID=UPI001B7E1D3C|nr:polygalacturonase 1 beta-like protein 3 [Juglans microcarpa x Juglans regia]
MTLLLLLLIFFISLTVVSAGAGGSVSGENPFTPKAYLSRYWTKEIRNDLAKPAFLLSKASPLSAVDSVGFSKLAAQNDLSSHLPVFCAAANLLCFPDLSPSLEKHDRDSSFTGYSNRNFTNYGSDRVGGADSFKNYSKDENIPVDSFRRYSRDSTGHKDNFVNYGSNGNVVDESFNSYATGATGGSGEFTTYADSVNVPNLRFTSYSDDSNGRGQSFKAYSVNANAGDQRFASYGKNGNAAVNEFNNYGTSSNVIGSGFSGYGQKGNAANDTFINYGNDQNNPQNTFKNYAEGGNFAVDTFTNYRENANVGDDSFQSYARDTNSAKVNFANYGKSFNIGTDKFSRYGRGADKSIGFKIYGVNTTFKEYAKKGVAFAKYTNVSSEKSTIMGVSGNLVKRWVEPGKFFRESMLKKGNVMPMPDIRDKMPKRSFLPRSISSKLPFSTSKISDLKRIFHAGDNSSMETMIVDSLNECERAPSQGETKRCVGSAEDLIDFATSVLGRNVVVRTTENVKGSKQNILIGSVKGINGGRVTQSVSCHQSLFPYLLYYCHSVPKVRVYEADIHDPSSKAKINHGVAICHVDTSAWSPSHGAFLALGSGPGRIEVCHWIFENDMTWTVAD